MVLLDRQADLVFGLRYDRIGTFFESMGNEGLAADRNAVTAYSNLYWGALSGSLQLSRETNNVDDLSSMPTDRLQNATMNLAYSFDPQTGRLAWLGSPYLSFTGFVADVNRVDTPTNYSGDDTDNISDSWTISGGSGYTDWYWNASYTLSQFEDYADSTDDTVNNFVSFGLGWTASDRLNMSSALSFGSLRNEDTSDTTYDTNINLGLNAIVIPDLVDLNLDYNLNLSNGSSDSPDRHILNSEVEYMILQPSRNRPGLAFAVRGSMEDTNGNAHAHDNETSYQVYTVLRVKSPFGFDF